MIEWKITKRLNLLFEVGFRDTKSKNWGIGVWLHLPYEDVIDSYELEFIFLSFWFAIIYYKEK